MTTHIAFTPTDEQRANLLRLAAHLDLGVTNLQFDMLLYSDVQGTGDELAHSCGTVGCAVGHGPTLGIQPLALECWGDYSKRSFGCNFMQAAHGWMFGSDWAMTDNTPRGAAARIRYALTHGIPENHREQKWGQATLSYTVPDRVEGPTVAAKVSA